MLMVTCIKDIGNMATQHFGGVNIFVKQDVHVGVLLKTEN